MAISFSKRSDPDDCFYRNMPLYDLAERDCDSKC